MDRLLPQLEGTPSGQIADKVLADINTRYGAAAARFVALEWESPWQRGVTPT